MRILARAYQEVEVDNGLGHNPVADLNQFSRDVVEEHGTRGPQNGRVRGYPWRHYPLGRNTRGY